MNSKDLAQFIDDSVQNTSINDLESQYKQISLMNDIYEGRGGIPVARRYKNNKEVVYIDDSLVNNLIVGRTRSGKSEDFIIPMLDIYSRAEEKSSLIIHDTNNELYSKFKETFENRGYEVIYFTPYYKNSSIKYNPLELIKRAYKDEHYSEAQLLCNILTHSLYDDPNTKDPFWENSAKSLVNALILAICDECIKNGEEDKITLYTVAKMLSELGGSSENIEDKEVNKLDEYFKKLPKESVAKSQYATISFADGNIRGAILSMAMSKLQNFTVEEIAKMTSKNSLELKDIGFINDENSKPKVIFIESDTYNTSNSVLVSIFIRQIYYSLSKQALLSKDKKCDREVNFILDDFFEIAPIMDMQNIMSVCLGRNIKFNLVIRDFCQLDKLYRDDSKTIIGNCGNVIYLGCSFETNREIQKVYLDKYIDKNKVDSEFLNELFLFSGKGSILFRNKRIDNNGNKIIPYPIFNFEENEMKSGHTYLEYIKK